MTLISINSPNWLALLQPSYYYQKLLFIFYSSFLKPNLTKLLVMLAINKTTAAKLIVLWNLPALLLLAGAYEVGTTVFA